MTIPEFLDVLQSRADEHIWYLAIHPERGRVLIRAMDDVTALCPIAVLSGQRPWAYCAGGRRLGLCEPDIYAIVDAVDAYPGYDPVLRAQVLDAVGLHAARMPGEPARDVAGVRGGDDR